MIAKNKSGLRIKITKSLDTEFLNSTLKNEK